MPGKRDQIFLLLFEPEMGELLYMLLTYEEYSVSLKEKVLKVGLAKNTSGIIWGKSSMNCLTKLLIENCYCVIHIAEVNFLFQYYYSQEYFCVKIMKFSHTEEDFGRYFHTELLLDL